MEHRSTYFFKLFLMSVFATTAFICWRNSFWSTDDFVERKLRDAYWPWHACMSKQISESDLDSKKLWSNIGNCADNCENSYLRDLPVSIFTNKDENKYHILPNQNFRDNVIVTIGIGKDVQAEKKLKSELPNTARFFGSDPVIENEKYFVPIGEYFPFAVSGASGIRKSSVLENGTYHSKSVIHVDLVYFLKHMIKPEPTLIDTIWIDAEGGEYDMMPLLRKGGELDQNRLTVCQFNLEVHQPSDEQKETFKNFIDMILLDGRYAFLKMTSAAGHWRMYFVNFESVECGKKYLVEIQ